MSFLNKVIGGFADSLGGSLLGGVTSLISAKSNRKWNEKMMDKQNAYNSEQAEIARQFNADEAQKTRDFNQQMDSTKYQRQVQDMQSAGVNPALAMSGGVTTQASSNATASSPMAASGAPGNAPLDLSSVAQLAMQAKQLKIQENLAKSQERKNNADAEGQEIANQYADEYNTLRNKGQELYNNLTASQKDQVLHEIDKIDATTDLLKKQAATEDERRSLTIAETTLKKAMKDKTDAEKQQIVEMLPFQKALAEAQTTNQQAQASLAFVNAAYQKGLIDNGYLDYICKEMQANAETAESFAAVHKFRNAIKSGNIDSAIKDVASEFKKGNYVGGIHKGLTTAIYGVRSLVDNIIPDAISGHFGVNVSSSMVQTPDLAGNPGRTIVKGLGK